VKSLATMPTPPARIPVYDEVKDEMMQQARIEGLERARRQWLDELSRGVCVDVRLSRDREAVARAAARDRRHRQAGRQSLEAVTAVKMPTSTRHVTGTERVLA
jgi:hypothetical protein